MLTALHPQLVSLPSELHAVRGWRIAQRSLQPRKFFSRFSAVTNLLGCSQHDPVKWL